LKLGLARALALGLLVLLVVAAADVKVSEAFIFGDSEPTLKLVGGPKELKMLAGTNETDLRYVEFTYEGRARPGVEWSACVFDVLRGAEAGLRTIDVSTSCWRDGSELVVRVSHRVGGVFEGGEHEWKTVLLPVARLYDANGEEVEQIYFDVADTVKLAEVTIKSIKLKGVDTSNVEYDYDAPWLTQDQKQRKEAPVNVAIIIYPVSDVKLRVELSEKPTVSTWVSVVYTAQSQTYSAAFAEGVMEVLIGSASSEFTIRLPILSTLTVTLEKSQIDLATATFDLSREVKRLGFAAVTALTPIQKMESRASYKVIGQIHVASIDNARITTKMRIQELNREDTGGPYTKPGFYRDLEVNNGDRLETLKGHYVLEFSASGKNLAITVKFDDTYKLQVKTIAGRIFYLLFMFMTASGFASVVVGVIGRRPELMSAGLILLASSALIFLVPTLIAYIVYTLTINTTGIANPLGIGSDLSVDNIGSYVDEAVNYIHEKARSRAKTMMFVSFVAVGALGLLLYIAAKIGVAGILTFGAVSIATGFIVGSIGMWLVSVAALNFLAAVVLDVLAVVYPIVINIAYAILLLTAIVLAIFAAFTGNYAPLYNTIVSISVLTLAVLLLPSVFATIDELVQDIDMSLPIVGDVSIPLNPFTLIGKFIVEGILLMIVIMTAINRALSALSSLSS